MCEGCGLANAAGWDERKPSERIRPPPVITRNVSEATWDVAVAGPCLRGGLGREEAKRENPAAASHNPKRE